MNNIKISNENDIIFYEDKDHNKKAEIRLDMVKWKCNCEHFSCVKQVSHTITVRVIYKPWKYVCYKRHLIKT